MQSIRSEVFGEQTTEGIINSVSRGSRGIAGENSNTVEFDESALNELQGESLSLVPKEQQGQVDSNNIDFTLPETAPAEQKEPETVKDYFDAAHQIDYSAPVTKDQSFDELVNSHDSKNVRSGLRQLRKQEKELSKGGNDAFAIIARSGGIDRQQAIKEGVDEADIKGVNSGVFGRTVFPHEGGQGIDDIGELLHENGFVGEDGGRLSKNEVLDIVHSGLAGEKTYSPEESLAQADADAQLEFIRPLIEKGESRIKDFGDYKQLKEKYGVEVADFMYNSRRDNDSSAENAESYEQWEMSDADLDQHNNDYNNYAQSLNGKEAESHQAESDALYELSDMAEKVIGEQAVNEIIDGVGGAGVDTADIARALYEVINSEGANNEQKTNSEKRESKSNGNERSVPAPATKQEVLKQKESELKAKKQLDKDANEAATSPKNNIAEPSQEQKEAGNYKLGHTSIQGLDISIENPKGSNRSGVDPDGNKWSVDMPAHYGYIKRTMGADGDHVDIYIGESSGSDKVFIVNQKDANNGKFDELKVIIGTQNVESAMAIYFGGFSDGLGGKRAGDVFEMSINEFKEYINNDKGSKSIKRGEGNARIVEASVIQHLAEYAGQNREPKEPALSQLRGKGDKGGPSTNGVHALPQSDGGAPDTVTSNGQDRKQRELRGRKSSLGDEKAASTKYEKESFYDRERREKDPDRVGRSEEPGSIDDTLSAIEGDERRGGDKYAGEIQRTEETTGIDQQKSTKTEKEQALSAKAKGLKERRADGVNRKERRNSKARKLFDEMSKDQLIDEVLKHELTGIDGRKAFVVDVQDASIVASIDADSLKWVNDNMSPDHGDALLQNVADAISEETDFAYHISGDEFYLLGFKGDKQKGIDDVTEKSILDMLQRVDKKLSEAVISIKKDDGSTIDLNGLNVTYGIGKDKNEADKKLKSEKVNREKSGQRASRGEKPLGATIDSGKKVDPTSQKDDKTASTKVTESKTAKNENQTDLSAKDQGQNKAKSLQSNEQTVTNDQVVDNEVIANKVLDAANVTGKDRLEAISKFRDGTYTLDDIRSAYPADVTQSDADKKRSPRPFKEQIKEIVSNGKKWRIIVDRYFKIDKVAEKHNPDTLTWRVEKNHVIKNGNFENFSWIPVNGDDVPASVAKKASSFHKNISEIDSGNDMFSEVDNKTSKVDKESKTNQETSSSKNKEKDNKSKPMFSRVKEEENLYVAHNLSSENVLHADKVGGLAVPSLAITTTDVGFENFGEISLIADKSLLKDSKAKTFGADIYSPRYPTVSYKIDINKYNEVVKSLNSELKSLGLDVIRTDIESRGVAEIVHDTSAQYLYLKSIGKEPKLRYKKKDKLPRYLTKYKGNEHLVRTADGFKESAEKYYKEQAGVIAKEVSDGDAITFDKWKSDALSNNFNEEGEIYYNSITNLAIIVSIHNQPKQVDRYDLDKKLIKKIRVKSVDEGFKDWIQDTFSDVVEKERIFNGFTYSGNRKYITHTLDNVVKIMKKELRGGENFNYGVGTIRSGAAPQFRTIKQIQDSRGKITSKEVMDKLKDETSDELIKVIDSLRPYYKYDADGFGYLDSASENLYEMARGKGLQDFENVPDDVHKEAAEFLVKLRDMPTEYFESKIQRAVGIDEFSAAVVPKGTSSKVIDILKGKGLQIRYYKKNDNADRIRAISGIKGILFSRENKNKSAALGTNDVKIITADLQKDVGATINVVDTERQLPEEIIAQAKKEGAEGEIRAVHWKGDIYIVSDQMRDRVDVESAVIHESQHFIGDNYFGKEKGAAYQTLWMKIGGVKGIKKLAEKSGFNMDSYFKTADKLLNDGDINSKERAVYLVDEFLAHTKQQQAYESFPDRIKRIIKEFYGKIRDLLRRSGFIDIPKTNDADISHLLKTMNSSVRGKPKGSSMNKVPAFMAFHHGVEAAQTNESDNPIFYSQLHRVLASKLPNKGTGGSFKKAIQAYAKKGEFKAEELEWSGVEEWLDSQLMNKVTKSDVLDFVTANEIKIQEVQKGGEGYSTTMAEIERIKTSLQMSGIRTILGGDGFISGIQASNGEPLRFVNDSKEDGLFPGYDPDESTAIPDEELNTDLLRAKLSESGIKSNPEIEQDIYELFENVHAQMIEDEIGNIDSNGTQYHDYTLPGGSNYTELLLTLDGNLRGWQTARDELVAKSPMTNHASTYAELNTAQKENFDNIFGDEDSFIRRENNETITENAYRSGHWKEANILAHVRYNERTDADGKKVLFIEETQSDWMQDGRKYGFQAIIDDSDVATWWLDEGGANEETPFSDLTISEQSDARIRYKSETLYGDRSVPNAPFKTSWPILVMKRMIRHAAENGFDSIAWTTGEQQNERYQLNKFVEVIRYNKDTNNFQVWKKDPDTTTSYMEAEVDKTVNKSDLESYIGKDLANKILSDEAVKEEGYSVLRGKDMEIGGGGMTGFYDNMLPKMVNKYVKKWGAKVGQSKTNTNEGIPSFGAYKSQEGFLPDENPSWLRKKYDNEINNTQVHSLDITEKMRESVMDGQPMFSRQGGDSSVHKKRTEKARSNVSRWLKRNLTKEGLMGKSTHEILLESDALKNVGEEEISYFVYNFEKAIKRGYLKPYNKLKDSELEKINDYLHGDKDTDIPSAVKDAADLMRDNLDMLSGRMLDSINDILALKVDSLSVKQRSEYDLAIATNGEQGKVPESVSSTLELMQTVYNNMGSYMTRSYQAFDDAGWKEKALSDKSLIMDAEAFIKTNNPDLTDSEVTGAVRNILQDAKDNGNFVSMIAKGSKVGSKDVSLTKKRKDVPDVIRRLLGEYKDPKVNFANSASKMQWYVANHYFLMSVRNSGLDSFLFKNPTNEFDARIATEGSEAMNPLDGLYSTEDFRQGMEDALDKWDGSDLMRDLIRLNSAVKYGKTILSPTTQMRNFYSASMFAVANGHFDLSHSAKAFKVAKADLFTHDEKWREYINDLIELGVLHDNPYSGELRDAINDVMQIDTNKKGIMQKPKQFLSFMQKTYQIGDDFWKIIGFENELQSQLDAGWNMRDARKRAAYRIRNGYPTYSMVPRGIKKLRRWPLIGTFVSFPYEIIRTSYNQAGFIKEDWADNRSGAVKRIIGMSIASSASYAMSQLSMALMGLSDDDDEAVRAQLPEWSRNSQLYYIGYDEDGLPFYLDLSYLDPYTYLKKPISALISGNNKNWDDKIIDAMSEIAGPFIGTDIAAGTVLEIWSNKKGRGGQVYNPEDTSYRISKDIINHARKGLQPGLMSNVERTALAISGDKTRSGIEYKVMDEALAWVGFRVGTLNLNQSMVYKGYGFVDSKRKSSSILKRVISSQSDVSDSEIEDAFNSMMLARSGAYEDIIKLVDGSRSLGVSDRNIKKSLSASNISVKDIHEIMRGNIPKWKMSVNFIKNASDAAIVSAASLDRKDEIKVEMKERQSVIKDLLSDYDYE